jgi:hypothetical protein
LPKSTYIKIAILNRHYEYGRRIGLVLLLLTLVALFGHFGLDEPNYLSILLGAWLLVLTAEIFIILAILRIAYHKDNKPYFQSRYMEIDDDSITAYLADGTQLKYKLSNIVKVRTIANAYIIMVSANQFLYLPMNAFKSKEDREKFEDLLGRVG